MSLTRPLAALFYRTEADNEPVREWLKGLPKDERVQIGIDIQTVQFRWPLGMPLVGSLGDGLWEVRTRMPDRIARVIFYPSPKAIILLHGFIKKTQKTPPEDKALALKRKNEYVKKSKG